MPMKMPSVLEHEIDPLVYQSWKTTMFFLTSWLCLAWTSFNFTPWGILSGLSWIPGGTLAVIGAQKAGLILAPAIINSGIILMNFFFGIVIFKEPMYSIALSCLAVVLLISGIVIMIVFSRRHTKVAPVVVVVETEQDEKSINEGNDEEKLIQDKEEDEKMHVICGLRVRDFHVGLLAAIGSGLIGGFATIPLKYAQKLDGFSGGIEFVISYAIGAGMWLCLFEVLA